MTPACFLASVGIGAFLRAEDILPGKGRGGGQQPAYFLLSFASLVGRLDSHRQFASSFVLAELASQEASLTPCARRVGDSPPAEGIGGGG